MGGKKSVPIKQDNDNINNQNINNSINIESQISANTIVISVIAAVILIGAAIIIYKNIKKCHRKFIEKEINNAFLRRVQARLSTRTRNVTSDGEV